MKGWFGMKKPLAIAVKSLLTILAVAFTAYFLLVYEYINSWNEIDNFFGWLPVIFLILFDISFIIALWMKRNHLTREAAAIITLCALLSLGLFFPSVTQHWWYYAHRGESTDDDFDYSPYHPFTAGNRSVVLDEEPDLRLSDNLPRLDGAKALYPIYAAFVSAVYDEAVYNRNPAVLACTNTASAYEAIMTGSAEVIFVAGPSDRQQARAKELGVNLQLHPIGREAFVFLTGKTNPIENLSFKQIHHIYSGKTAYWITLGWKDGGKILAFQRPADSGSQTGLQKVMKNHYLSKLPIMQPPPIDPALNETDSLMRQVSVWRGDVQPATGYSYRYFAVRMYPNPDAKLLSIEGVAPIIDNIKNGSYPMAANFYAVTNGEPTGNAKALIDWILSPQGQKIIEQTGYVSLDE
jgi:phosphate transport system substrate-binding protein